MRAGELHIMVPGSPNIREVKEILAEYSDAKVVKKNAGVHAFLPDSTNLDKFHESVDRRAWTVCTGCDLCVKPATLRAALYPPLVLLPTNTKISTEEASRALVQRYPGYTHVAINAPIQVGDRVRRPKIKTVVGGFGVFNPTEEPSAADFESAFWCTSTQNGIYQTWAPMYTMFSRGNITEKKRVLDTFALQSPIAGSTVVDLYAGIGYFTLSYALNSPRTIYCWELNWWSVEGLLRAARRNKVSARAVKPGETYVPRADDRIVVFVEDNQRALERLDTLDLAQLSHINMGLLPDCRAAFPVAQALARRADPSSNHAPPVFHVHENVRVAELDEWRANVEATLGQCLHVEKIKSYSPGVVHVCGDFRAAGSEEQR